MPDLPATEPLDLIGPWRKSDSPPCAAKYPELLTFAAGTFRGSRGEGQGFVCWDAGIYRAESETRLLLSTATDELVAYTVRLEDGVLSVTDPEGCQFAYRRVPPQG